MLYNTTPTLIDTTYYHYIYMIVHYNNCGFGSLPQAIVELTLHGNINRGTQSEISLGSQASLTLSTSPRKKTKRKKKKKKKEKEREASSLHVSFFSQFLWPPFIACIELVSLGTEARVK